MTTSSSANLSKPAPGSRQMRSCATPARMRVRAWSPRKPITWRMMGASSGSVKRCCEAMGRGAAERVGRESSRRTSRLGACEPSPSCSQCMTTQPQSVSAATCTMSGLVKPLASFTMAAPRRTHILATSGWQVFTETTAPSATSARITGTTRSASSLEARGSWPGAAGTAATSTMSAPSSSMSRPRSAAALTSTPPFPSGKASGVTSRMPMMRGRASESSCEPTSQVA